MRISERDLEIWNNLKSRFNDVPEDKQSILRKYEEQKKAGLFSIPGSRIAAKFIFRGNEISYDKVWFLVMTAELNSFFCSLEEKYGFSGHTHTVNDQGEIVPIKTRT